MSTTPTRPGAKPKDDTEKTIRERLATYDRDKKDAKPWPDVKARILKQLRPR
jgi:hypothetical protein